MEIGMATGIPQNTQIVPFYSDERYDGMDLASAEEASKNETTQITLSRDYLERLSKNPTACRLILGLAYSDNNNFFGKEVSLRDVDNCVNRIEQIMNDNSVLQGKVMPASKGAEQSNVSGFIGILGGLISGNNKRTFTFTLNSNVAKKLTLVLAEFFQAGNRNLLTDGAGTDQAGKSSLVRNMLEGNSMSMFGGGPVELLSPMGVAAPQRESTYSFMKKLQLMTPSMHMMNPSMHMMNLSMQVMNLPRSLEDRVAPRPTDVDTDAIDRATLPTMAQVEEESAAATAILSLQVQEQAAGSIPTENPAVAPSVSNAPEQPVAADRGIAIMMLREASTWYTWTQSINNVALRLIAKAVYYIASPFAAIYNWSFDWDSGIADADITEDMIAPYDQRVADMNNVAFAGYMG